MQANTALSFILIGLSFFFIIRSYKKASILCAGTIIALAILILFEYIFDVSLGIDQLFIEYNLDYEMTYPGRLAPNTAVCLLLIGISIIISNRKLTNGMSFLVELLTGVAASIAIITLVGYLSGIYTITGWISYLPMPIHTAIGIIILSVGLFVVHSIYSFYRERNVIGPLVGSIFLTIYITISLWQGFQNFQNTTIRALSQNNADFISRSIRINLEDIAEASNRMIQRWSSIGEFSPKLWNIDTENFLNDFESIENLIWYDDQFVLKETTMTFEKITDEFFSEIFSQIQKSQKLNQIYHKENGNFLYLLMPLYSEENRFQGVLVTEINMLTLMEYSIPPYLYDYYSISITDNTPRTIMKNEVVSAVRSPFLDWYVELIPKKDATISSFVPMLILASGFIFISCILASAYLLMQVFNAKERILAAYKDKENAFAFRQAILDASSYSIIAVDTNGIIQTFNKAAERMLQWKSGDMVHKQTPAVFHDPVEMADRAKQLSAILGEDVDPGLGVFIVQAKRDRREEHEWSYIRKDGTRFPVHLSISPVKNYQGAIIGYVGIANDLTQVKELERMKNELIAITTHEIRSPLTSIKGALDLITHGADEKKRESLLKIARSNCDRLLRLTNDILDLQKMESGKMIFYPSQFSLEDLFKKTVEINKIYAQTHDTILVEPVNIPDCTIYADEDRILQVLTNFVTNAIKNSPANTEVSLEARLNKDSIYIGVRDQGSGIPKEYQDLIFKKFAQVPSLERARDGTGLGLSICKSIIKEHSGKIGFDTSPEGSVFWFIIPLRRNNFAAAQVAGERDVQSE
jgi:PAS domain S-box-containing protein